MFLCCEGFPFAEPRQYEVNIAVSDINAATTEAEAAKAAAMVYRPRLDTPDVVVNAFERKIAQLRALPRLPMTFNPLPLILAAYKLHWANLMSKPLPPAKKPQPRPGPGPGPGHGPSAGFGSNQRNSGCKNFNFTCFIRNTLFDIFKYCFQDFPWGI